jgi:hypothetical protein
MAQAEGVPVYTIFTNEQLAQRVQSRATTKAALEKIAGVGDVRIEKYGGRMLVVQHLVLSWRSCRRLRQKLIRLERLFADGFIDAARLQQRTTALVAFAQSAGVSSWRFRTAMLQQLAVGGLRARTG